MTSLTFLAWLDDHNNVMPCQTKEALEYHTKYCWQVFISKFFFTLIMGLMSCQNLTYLHPLTVSRPAKSYTEVKELLDRGVEEYNKIHPRIKVALYKVCFMCVCVRSGPKGAPPFRCKTLNLRVSYSLEYILWYTFVIISIKKNT